MHKSSLSTGTPCSTRFLSASYRERSEGPNDGQSNDDEFCKRREHSVGLERPPSSSSCISMNPRAVRGESSTRWTRGHFGDWCSQKCCIWGHHHWTFAPVRVQLVPRCRPEVCLPTPCREPGGEKFDIWEAYRNNSITSTSSINRCHNEDPPMRHQHQLHLVALHQRVGL